MADLILREMRSTIFPESSIMRWWQGAFYQDALHSNYESLMILSRDPIKEQHNASWGIDFGLISEFK